MSDITLGDFIMPFQEKEAVDYLYIDSANRVHLLLPVINGQNIALDNTCQTVSQLRWFIAGREAEFNFPAKPSCLQVLERYENDLTADIDECEQTRSHTLLKQQKQERLLQIQAYRDLVANVVIPLISPAVLNGRFGDFPLVIKRALSKKTNALSIRLNPVVKDPYLRLDSPVFSLRRSYYASGLGAALADIFPVGQDINAPHPKNVLIQVAAEYFRDNPPFNFAKLQTLLQNEIHARLEVSVDLTKPAVPDRDNNKEWVVTEETLVNNWFAEEDFTASEWARSLLSTCLTDEFWEEYSGSLFNENDRTKLIIKVQFFLAQINLHCYSEGLSHQNFGQVFDEPPLRENIARIVRDNVLSGTVEEELFKMINQQRDALGLAKPLMDNDKAVILAKFNEQFKTIKESPHFDEFLVFMPNKPGQFVSHHGRISIHLADVLPEFRLFASKQSNQHLKLIKRNGKAFVGHGGKLLSHKNKGVHLETVTRLVKRPKVLARILCQKNPFGRFVFEDLPVHAISLLQSNEEQWTSLKRMMKQSIDVKKDAQDRLKEFFVKPQKTLKAVLDLKIKGVPADADKDKKVSFFGYLKRPASILNSSVDDYIAARDWWKIRHPNRTRQLNEIRQIANDIQDDLVKYSDRPTRLSALIAVLNKIDDEIGHEFGFFSSKSKLKNILIKTKRQLMSKYIAACEKVEALAKREENVLSQQNVILKDRESPLHSLNSTWFLPENKAYLEALIALPEHYHTQDAVLYFNGIEPYEMNEAMMDALKKTKIDFGGPVVTVLKQPNNKSNHEPLTPKL